MAWGFEPKHAGANAAPGRARAEAAELCAPGQGAAVRCLFTGIAFSRWHMTSEYKRPESAPDKPRPRRHPYLPWACLGAGVLLVVGSVFAWGFFRPQHSAELIDPNDPEMVRLREESVALERQFARACDSRTPTAEDLELLQRAIDNQREWMRATGSADPEQAQRAAALDALYADVWQRHASATSNADEVAGRQLLAAGRRDEALQRLRSALDLQRQLNQRREATGGRDLSRETSLRQELERLDAEPIGAELADVTARAAKLRDENNTAEALAAYTRARELQQRLNREFGRTRYASLSNLEKLEEEVATIETSGLAEEVMALSAQAAEAQGAGRSADAVALFEKAADVQRRINDDHPRSRHVSAARVETLEVARQTELSADAMRRAQALDREVAEALQARRFDDLEPKLREGSELNDTVATQYPRSRRLDPELRLKFNFLLVHRERIAPVQAELADGLRPVPGRAVRILRTEVPQRLYEMVMQANPSRQTGADLPVESVNAYDTAEFCRRLSWMLGRTVRLPTEAEFRAALGLVPDGAALAEQVWSQERSGQNVHPVASTVAGPNGCYDLLGNVAEWLAPTTDDAEAAPVAGGSCTDALADLARVPLEKHSRLDRARTIGFRVVVE